MMFEQVKDSSWAADQCLTYKEAGGLKLPMQIFYPNRKFPDKPTPAVVCIHGGAWQTGRMDNSRWDGGRMAPQARYYAARGLIGIAISYRAIRKNDPAHKTDLFDLIEDCRDAVLYVRNHADALGVEKDKIVVMGDSAGGHLAICLGLRRAGPATPNLIIACNPITDCTIEKWSFCVKAQAGAAAELTQKASPLHNIREGCPPLLLMHGLEDQSVDPLSTIEFHKKMMEKGNPCELQLIPGAKHAFILFNHTAPDELVVKSMRTIDRYLDLFLYS